METNISLAQFTTLGIGGPAKFFTTIKTRSELDEAVKFAQKQNIPFLLLGGGSNLLISDEGFPGLVIKNEIQGITADSNLITVQSGTLLGHLIQFSIQNNLGKIHKLLGIPGTVGGAIFGNAGAYGQAVGDCVQEVTCIDPKSGSLITLSKEQCHFGYRDSDFKRNSLVIVEVKFEFEPTNSEILKQEAGESVKQRISYAGIKSPGSFFKNIPVEKLSPEILKLIPEDKINHGKVPAGCLLESIGAKGQKSGEVEVSDFHANVIINKGQGKAFDFYKLVSDLSKKVKEKYGIELEPEVQLINLPPIQAE